MWQRLECPDDAAERAAFYMLPLVQTTIYAHCRKAHETGVARRRHLPAAVEHKRREAAIDRAIGSVGCQLFCGLFLGPRSAVSQVTRTFPARKKTHRQGRHCSPLAAEIDGGPEGCGQCLTLLTDREMRRRSLCLTWVLTPLDPKHILSSYVDFLLETLIPA